MNPKHEDQAEYHHMFLKFTLLLCSVNFYKCKLNMKLQMNYLEKDYLAHLIKCWHVINLSYKVLHMQQ